MNHGGTNRAAVMFSNNQSLTAHSFVVGVFVAAVGEVEGDLDGLLEGLVHVEILPLLGGGLVHAHQGIRLLGFLEGLGINCISRSDATEILLRGDKHDGDFLLDLTDLSLPLGNVIDGGLLHGIAAEEEQIGILVHNFTVGGNVLVTGGIVDLELHHLLVDVLGASVDIKHCGLVVVAEGIVQVVLNQTRLTDGRVAYQHNLASFLAILQRLGAFFGVARSSSRLRRSSSWCGSSSSSRFAGIRISWLAFVLSHLL